MALVILILTPTGQKLIDWSLNLYMSLLLCFFLPFFQIQKNVTLYVFLLCAYVFSNYGAMEERFTDVSSNWHCNFEGGLHIVSVG